MATWTVITDPALQPGKPIRSIDGLALRDNPIAIAEGATGAPKVQNPALDDDVVDDRTLGGSATTVGRDWVLARTALSAVGALGTYAAAYISGLTANQTEGTTFSGSNLRYASVKDTGAATTVEGAIGTLPGTWRLMGYISSGSSSDLNLSLFLRIS